jgi:hydrogenase maturation protein HypF
VQHHHAHVASCLADNGWPADGGQVIGVAFDGTGYGLDGTIWGGEFLVADYAECSREGHLAPVPMPGGAAAIRQPWRMAAAYLDAAGLDTDALASGVLAVRDRNAGRWPAILSMARRRVNAPLSSGAGRMFDAAAAVLSVRDEISYEGQAAIELEQLADPAETGAYRAPIGDYRPPSWESRPESFVAPAQPGTVTAETEASPTAAGSPGAPFTAHGADLVRAAFGDLVAGVPRSVIAARFHHGVAGVIEDGCLLLRERHGLGTVALSGGVFQNTLLLHRAVTRLEGHGFTVLTHSRVPCNDGGISLGQAAVAAARDRRGSAAPAADS